MAKAVTEVAVGAAAIGLAIAMPGIGAGLAWMTAGMQSSIIGGLASLGGSQVLAGLADALRPHQGGIAMGVTSPIGPWNYLYGRQKVGGIEIFRESNNSQGTSNNKELHRVYVLGCHPSQLGSWELRVDGRVVVLVGSGPGFKSISPTQYEANITSISRASGVVTMHLSGPIFSVDGDTLQMRGIADNTFNGTFTVTQVDPADYTQYTYVCGGPDTATSGGTARTTYSDYQDKIYVEMLNGNHTATFAGLLASGTSWKSSDLCLGHTLAYVRMGYDDKVFPSSIPNVSFVIDGKNNIWDPRSGLHAWTNNPALCIADWLSMPPKRGGFGLTIGTDIPTDALIAAANVCDELVDLAAGGSTSRYTCDTYITLDQARGATLKNLLSSCAGRISYQGGQYSSFPGAWVTPSVQLSDADIVGSITLRPRLSIRESCNSVKGTYVSPENNYQLADVPPYAKDPLHGYVSDPYLAEDNGERIFREAHFPCTASSAVAQRLEKIALMRTRQQMRFTARCSMKAYRAVALDVVQITHPRYTWINKNFEVLASRLGFERRGNAYAPYVELDLAETDASIFDWTVTEQLTPQGYRQPNNVGSRVCAPPEDVTLYSGQGQVIDGITYPSTITTRKDGTVDNAIYVRWNQPNDANVVSGGHMEVQWQPVGASAWFSLAKIDPSASSAFIHGVSDGSSYMVQVRAVNCAGVPSDWVVVGPITVSDTYSVVTYSGQPVAPPGTLTAQGMSDGTAQITILPFTCNVYHRACTPSPSTITALTQKQLWYVYYVDLTFSGGTITPIATQDPADFENKQGYFLIGSITTPSYTPRYQPSTFSDIGSDSTINPAAAYDNNVLTQAVVPANWWTITTSGVGGPTYTYVASQGQCVWSGFPPVTLTAAATLHVLLAATQSTSTPFSCTVDVKIGGTVTNLVTLAAAVAETDYTMTIPSGTDLSTISIPAASTITAGSSPGSGACTLQGFEIYIQ